MNRHKKHKKKPFQTLTLRNIPDDVADLVCDKASTDQLSFTQALVALLQERLGNAKKAPKARRDVSWMAEKADDNDLRMIEASVREGRRPDPESWK